MPAFSFDYGNDDDGSEKVSEDEVPEQDATEANTMKDAAPAPSATAKRKKAAWVDLDDATLSVSLATEKRLRKPCPNVLGQCRRYAAHRSSSRGRHSIHRSAFDWFAPCAGIPAPAPEYCWRTGIVAVIGRGVEM